MLAERPTNGLLKRQGPQGDLAAEHDTHQHRLSFTSRSMARRSTGWHMRKQQHENGLGTLAAILLLIVPATGWLFFDLQSAVLLLIGGLLIVAVESVEVRGND